MGNCYYLVSPAHERVLDCSKLRPEVTEHGTVYFPVSQDPDEYARRFSPQMAIAATAWLAHYRGPGMRVECDAAFSWEFASSHEEEAELMRWMDWTEDDVYRLRNWLFEVD